MTGLVIDASVSANWLFDDDHDPRADSALILLETGPGIVPQLWHYEMRNILLVAHRRDRITAAGMAARVEALADLPLETDTAPDLTQAFALAGAHRLSFYDALYLELAIRRGIGLASLDARVNAVARILKVPTLDGSRD